MRSPRGVTEEDMGKDDPNTINYINIRTNDIPPGHEFRIKQVEEMIELTHRWCVIEELFTQPTHLFTKMGTY